MLAKSADEDPTIGEPVTVTGWGRTGDDDPASQFLMYNDNPTILDPEICAEPFGHSITDKVICINAVNGGTCSGDSGGPLNYPQEDGSYIQVGLTSFGPSTGCENGLPHVFTRVTSYYDWIINVIGE